MSTLTEEESGSQSQFNAKETSIDHKMEEYCSLGSAVAIQCTLPAVSALCVHLRVVFLWICSQLELKRASHILSDECDDHVCEMYYQWLGTLNQSVRSINGPALAYHKGKGTLRSEVWFDSYLMNSHDNDRWMRTFHMRRATFLWICSRLELYAWKEDSICRPNIPLASQLGGTLYQLMTGASHRDIAERFGIEVSCVQTTVEKCVASIVEVLGLYLQWPAGDAMATVSRQFLLKWSLPNCQGSLGTTRIDVLSCEGNDSSRDAGSDAGRHSIALMAVCDSSGAFLNVYCAYPGTLPNSTVLRNSGLYDRAMGGHILSEPLSLLDSGYVVRPYLLSDTSFQESPWLFCPEPWSQSQQGRWCVEFGFAELRRVFKSLDSGINCRIQTSPTFVHACCILHNILLLRSDTHVRQPSIFSIDQVQCGEFQWSEEESESDGSSEDLDLEWELEQDSKYTSEDDSTDMS